ncbi:hypothetical protein [Pasteurella multocida]|uniref:hypothetical protein n=1 Tax=Pasteurella multocida TaxID=747 RepID=UPI002C04E616|nr:hypothetical protein [Pasteurella multocida]MEB3457159.1 hypothetical protein [Pasteurella multocida]
MKDQKSICINIQLDTPFVTKDEYKRRTGLPMGTINDQLKTGKLPILPRKSPKEKVLINMVALAKQAAS